MVRWGCSFLRFPKMVMRADDRVHIVKWWLFASSSRWLYPIPAKEWLGIIQSLSSQMFTLCRLPAFQNGWFSDSGLRQERMPHMYIYCINSARTRLSGLGSTLDTSDQSQIKLRKKLCHHHCSGYIRLNAVGWEWLWRVLLPAGFTRVVCRSEKDRLDTYSSLQECEKGLCSMREKWFYDTFRRRTLEFIKPWSKL